MSDNHLIQALQNPTLYPHSVDHFQVIETHISWVILTGDFAYKIKKPIDLGFLNFSSLAARHHYCLHELELNHRLAPQIYLDVIAIGGKSESPILGEEPAIEYAVKMRQFPQSARLDTLLANGALQPEHIDQLSIQIAKFHEQVETASQDSPYGNPITVFNSVEESFQQIIPLLNRQEDINQVDTLNSWILNKQSQFSGQITQRKEKGFVRNCHGDMHLANIALTDKEIIIFDCIEFNESLRWIDVISDISFTVMDLIDRGHSHYAARLLDRYLQYSGDYDGLRMLQFYLVYRALVRAKVAIIRSHQPIQSKQEQQQAFKQYQDYITLADSFTHNPPQKLFITHGVSGSGKTTLTQPLLEQLSLIRLRADVERKRLFGLKAEEKTNSKMVSKVYSADASQRTYRYLLTTAKNICQSGFSVIIDATFLKSMHRKPFQELAKELNIPFVILHFYAEEQLLHQWIKRRIQVGTDASEATIKVLQHQLTIIEPLSENEADHIISINSGHEYATEQLLSQVIKHTSSNLI